MQTLAVIGTGISGMAAAWFLKDRFAITLYEKASYAGGHTNTLTIDENGTPVHIDSAFMVYNEITYPNLTRLFRELGVVTQATDMSFSVQHKPSALEYCGTGLSGLFAQRAKLFSVRHWRMLLEMDRFNKQALEVLATDAFAGHSLRAYCRERGYSEDFFHKFLVPISSAVWSTPPDKMGEFSVVTLVRFFKNHGFMGLRGHYQWRTVTEGSQRYREKILAPFAGKILLNTAVTAVRRTGAGVEVVEAGGGKRTFDKVICAGHADETLAVLQDATPLERDLLSRFPYQPNKATLHTDETVMPKTRRAWSSWNYRIGTEHPSVIYWMNNLQKVSQKRNYFISINESGEVDRAKVLWETTYAHPLFDVAAAAAQPRLPELNARGPVYFCGAYFKYGFHEDGLTSGLEAARAVTGESLWS